MDIELVDDGTLDTVLSVNGQHVRFAQEFVVGWRHPRTGELDLARFICDNYSDIREQAT